MWSRNGRENLSNRSHLNGNNTVDDYDYDNYGAHTGDPLLDLEYEQYNNHLGSDAFNNFITSLYEAMAKGNRHEMAKLYEQSWPTLIEEYFKSSMLPGAKEVSNLVDGNELFLILYLELYYRHIHANVSGGPSLTDRFDSYQNYCKIFNFLLFNATGPAELILPDTWIWEMIDEYIYQFQEFQKFMRKVFWGIDDDKKNLLLEYLNQYQTTWQPLQIINVLETAVEKSDIKEQLEALYNGGNPLSVAGLYGKTSLYKMLGYFSLVGLLRLNSQFGDYYQAIKAVEHVEFDKMKSLFSRVPGCHISMYYYVGFAYMMMRRYDDAIRTLTSILLYIQRTKGMFQARTYQNDQINKQGEQMFTLLCICLALHPRRIDESLHTIIFQNQENKKETNYSQKIYNMQAGDLSEFEACFAFACPKFLSPVPPSLDDKKDNVDSMHKEPLRLQQKVFMDEVRQQMILPTIRSYLKLYTSMPMDKLAKYMCTPAEVCTVDALESNLLCFKHKMMNLVWTSKGTSGLEGEFQAESEVDFYIDKNMIHIADTKVDRRYGDFFIRQIHKFEELNRGLKAIKM